MGESKMCKLCEEIKRNFPSYIYCPYCGKNFDSHGFVPTYFKKVKYDDCDKYGRPVGLPTVTIAKIK